jgi:hypothetical protein
VLGSVHTAIRGVEIKCEVGPKCQQRGKMSKTGKSVKLGQRLTKVPQTGEYTTNWQKCHKLAEMPGR